MVLSSIALLLVTLRVHDETIQPQFSASSRALASSTHLGGVVGVQWTTATHEAASRAVTRTIVLVKGNRVARWVVIGVKTGREVPSRGHTIMQRARFPRGSGPMDW